MCAGAYAPHEKRPSAELLVRCGTRRTPIAFERKGRAVTRVLYTNPGGAGYAPVLHMARLAAAAFDAELTVLPPKPRGWKDRISLLLPRARGKEACLIICASPLEMYAAADLARHSAGRVVAWVFDSFWVDHAPKFTRYTNHIDHIFVTEPEDLEGWRKVARAPVDWLPWGSDVLGRGSSNPDREVDLLRVGRQPPSWDDDEATTRACAPHGVRFAGRPPFHEDPEEGYRALQRAFTQAKFTLAFSNSVSPNLQTHPTREYITGRWTDALAAGVTVVGVPPRTEVVDKLLWPGALLDPGTADRDQSLGFIAEAVRSWSPRLAAQNHALALERLDWRWRFEKIATALGISPAPLAHDLALLRAEIARRAAA